MPARFRRPFIVVVTLFASVFLSSFVHGAEPPELLPAFLRDESDGPRPPAVNQPVRVKQALVPGTTYEVHVKGTMKVDAEDDKFTPLLHISGKLTLNYAFEAVIERYIKSNDGQRIVEERWFRTVRTMKIASDDHTLRLEPGPVGKMLFEAVQAAVTVFVPVKVVEVGLAELLAILKNAANFTMAIQDRVHRGYKVGAFAALDELSGKKVRLTYVDGQGVKRLEALLGEIKTEEAAYHMSSVVLSDCLLFPDETVPVGENYPVKAEVFADKIDPSLMARVGGTVEVTRLADKNLYLPDLLKRKLHCVVLKVKSDNFTFEQIPPEEHHKHFWQKDRPNQMRTIPDILEGSTPSKTQTIGSFSPDGTVYFDPVNQMVVWAHLTGSGEMHSFLPRHLLHSTKKFYKPSLILDYSCRIKTPPRGDGR